ncbi:MULTISPECIES: restriction endonuclease [unclassified Frondihabitans]|uniref:restriction endonuclease n=1 Tax=unclassified Frondihabitans TaxID=2626248 RepID=UPI000F9AB143|nr:MULTISPECIES: restriction endonuclease [unclassified Frondihabitans]RPE77790.1 restriction endonuclease [Frondihabitans sp. PhB153]RPF08069.1 restriction endonuclease [Frondihabitans sp. PhB161]
MLILGKTADDKGSQLEALVHTTLAADGYRNIARNRITSGGNELDVVAERVSKVLGQDQNTPVLCEAKAYADAVSMPVWQKFLGKVFLGRLDDSSTVGVLIALNGLNGNAAGSYDALKKRDKGVVVVDGTMLEVRAAETGELADEQTVLETVAALFQRHPQRIESAYYGGAYLWIVRWQGDDYSVVNGQGGLIPLNAIENLRLAMNESVGGHLLEADEARVRAEARHATRMQVFNRLFGGEVIALHSSDNEVDAIVDEMTRVPFCKVGYEGLALRLAEELDAVGIAELFQSLFQSTVRVGALHFIAESFHEPYVARMLDLLPELQPGVVLGDSHEATLRLIAPNFPSLWVLVTRPMEFIASHQSDEGDLPDLTATDRNAFLEEVARSIRADFANPFLRGFLFDHLGVVEIEERREITVKSNQSSLGTIRLETRDSIGQLSDELAGDGDLRHILIRVYESAPQPWDQPQPEPVVELDSLILAGDEPGD